MSLEREILDQIVEGDLPLQVIRKLFPDNKAFTAAIHGLLRHGDVRLLSDGVEVPRWRWHELFEAGGVTEQIPKLRLAITDQGTRTLEGGG